MNAEKSNIFLVGMPGAGKTTVGRQLARRLQRRFVDADHEVEARTGVRIPVIFDIEGEQGFRDREARVIAELAAQPLLSAAMLEAQTGISRDTAERLLARLRDLGLAREITGARRFRLWTASG